jgi:hypothetical protein
LDKLLKEISLYGFKALDQSGKNLFFAFNEGNVTSAFAQDSFAGAERPEVGHIECAINRVF